MGIPRFSIYKDQEGDWRWRLRAANGLTIADSGEGYTRERDAKRAVRGIKFAVAATMLLPTRAD